MKVDGIELDVPMIRAGEIVVIHDFADGGRFVERLTG